MTRQPTPEYMERAHVILGEICALSWPFASSDKVAEALIALALEDEAAAARGELMEDHDLAPGCHAGICSAEECVACAAAPPPDAGAVERLNHGLARSRLAWREEAEKNERRAQSAEATVERLREELEDRKRSGVDWTAPDVDAWGIAAERHGLPSLRAKINGLFRRAEKAEAALRIDDPTRCYDCPPVGYSTDETRCTPCDRRTSLPKEAEADKDDEYDSGRRWF